MSHYLTRSLIVTSSRGRSFIKLEQFLLMKIDADLSMWICLSLSLSVYLSVSLCHCLSGTGGNFSSPGYPDNYPLHASCRYVFQGTASAS